MTDMQPHRADRSGPDEAKGQGRIQAAALLCVVLTVVVIAVTAPMVMGSIGTDPSDELTQVKVVIDYDGNWSGTLGSPESSTSYNGTGPASFIVPQESTGGILVSAVIQKLDDGPGMLKVSIEKMDGTILQIAGTIRPYGSVTVGWTNL
jgi:hypothetical protein